MATKTVHIVDVACKLTFKKAGTFRYFCMVHPNVSAMKGTIVVK